MTRLIILSRAAREIEDIYDYIAQDNPMAARKVVDRIYVAANYLAAYPRSGHQTLKRGIRMFVVNPYPYLLFFSYRPASDELRITSVRHSSRRRPSLADEIAEFRQAAVS